MADTIVTFASGTTEGRGTVVRSETDALGRPLVVVDRTPFHPVDHTWPDQPGDVGCCGGSSVVDTLMAAAGPDGALLVGPDIPVKRGEAGWDWFVVHRLDETSTLPAIGAEVSLDVDDQRRRALSAAHTACHLSALAMNRAAAGFWRKDVRVDSLGNPDLDQLAMVSSVMDVEGSSDVYRFGKSLRKRGFESAAFVDALSAIAFEVESQLTTWVESGASVAVVDDGDLRVTAPRRWTCALADGLAEIACGGTHVPSLAALDRIRVDYQLAPDGTGLTVRTTPTQAA
ncbi:MAG TPA: metal-dependent hydrolase [Actinomycetes bacterium]|nr:metal-dependent hydrolase [Actinomycetes bacterium]